MKKTLITIIVILAVLIGGGLFYISGMDKPYDPNDSNTVVIDIPMGSSTSDIASILKENGIIGDARKFKLFSRLNHYDGQYVAGTYSVTPSMSPDDICKTLTSGEITATQFLVPEGYTIDDIANDLDKYGLVDKYAFIQATQNGDFSEYEFIPTDVPAEGRLEGLLFPATYTIPYAAGEEDIIRMMLDKFSVEYDEEIKSQAKKLGMTTNEVLTVASIIEKETMYKEDKPIVASVIYNRLDQGMPLQMDTTVIYALHEDKVDLTYDDIAIESPYNTYYVNALPIGPICSPGIDSIQAALNPAKTNYMYFVVSDKGDGSISFAETAEQFELDKEAYYAARENEEPIPEDGEAIDAEAAGEEDDE